MSLKNVSMPFLVISLCIITVLIIYSLKIHINSIKSPKDQAIDSIKSPKDQAIDLVKKMTLEEKISLMYGLGNNTVYVGETNGIPRLNIPALKYNDGPQGFRNPKKLNLTGTSTCFPCSLAISSTWDQNAAYLFGDTIGKEFYNKGATTYLGPGVNILRIPLNGRNFEYISGEDPYLGSLLAKEVIESIQNNKIVATIKHYILNNQETHRYKYSAEIDEKTLHELYYPPFKTAITQAKVGSIMCAYNKINSKYACDNNITLNIDLKQDMQFNGYVMSDWWATHDFKSIYNGLNQQMPDHTYFNQSSLSTIDIHLLNDSAIRILSSLFK